MNDIEQRFEKLNVWSRDGERAPHKPLLVLLALAAFSRGQQQLRFADCEKPLDALLREFGPTRKAYHPEYPFWRLTKDALWELEADGPLRPRASNSDPTRVSLRKADARGHFPADVTRALASDPALVGRIAARVLDGHFPETLHEDILQAVGLTPSTQQQWETVQRRRRDPEFRAAVLMAYQYRCAVCGLDLRLGSLSIGLEAAHVKWHQAFGPDEVANGVCLCTLHHKLFDLGTFTLHPSGRLLVSERVHGTTGFEETLLRFHGVQAARPIRPEHIVHDDFLDWHRVQVFKREARPLSTAA